jgi:hypothetical protein
MRGQPTRRWLPVVAGVSVIGVWLAANVYPYATPQPRFSAADLPSLPSESDNGWSQVTSNKFDVDIPKRLAGLIDSPEQDWNEIDAASLREFLTSPGAGEAIGRVEAAARAPVFADTCVIDRPCYLYSWHKAHKVALLQAIERSLAGDEAEAAKLVAELIRLDAAQLASARTAMSVFVALANLDDALANANALAERMSDDSADAARTVLADAARSLDIETIDLRATVINDYLVYENAVEALAGEDHELIVEVSGPRWLYNRGLTLREVDERFARRYEAAVEGDVFAALGGGESSPKQALGWWLRNPVGDLLLDALYFNPESVAEDITAGRERVADKRAKLLARPQFAAAD